MAWCHLYSVAMDNKKCLKLKSSWQVIGAVEFQLSLSCDINGHKGGVWEITHGD